VVTLLGNWEKIEIRVEGTETISRTVNVGRWEVTVEAFYDGRLYARGSDIINVIAGQDNGVQISMAPADDNGNSSGGSGVPPGSNLCTHNWGTWSPVGNLIPHPPTSNVCPDNQERRDCTHPGCNANEMRPVPCPGTQGLVITNNGDTVTVTGINIIPANPPNNPPLTHICIPNGVTIIGNDAFKDMYTLTSVTIPIGVLTIDDGAFSGTGITSITIPASVTFIGESAFALTYLTSVTIPNSVTNIGIRAFEECTELANVTIGNSVTTIGEEAFAGCESLETVTINRTIPPTLGQSVFINTHSELQIRVPADSVDNYRTAWNDLLPAPAPGVNRIVAIP
jgi:hypothetical protein